MNRTDERTLGHRSWWISELDDEDGAAAADAGNGAIVSLDFRLLEILGSGLEVRNGVSYSQSSPRPDEFSSYL
jgi:hypothetical protein